MHGCRQKDKFKKNKPLEHDCKTKQEDKIIKVLGLGFSVIFRESFSSEVDVPKNAQHKDPEDPFIVCKRLTRYG